MKFPSTITTLLLLLGSLGWQQANIANADNSKSLRVLNFQADNGFQHKSKSVALAMVESLGEANDWQVVTTIQASSLTSLDLDTFDVVVFNNNCGNKGAIMTAQQQSALQAYVRSGGGFVGVHCAGAIWKEGGEFQPWYEGLIGTKLVDHPKVQEAKLKVEDRTHIATRHLPEEWTVTDEWHRFGSNPRENVRVLISVDEDSYQGKQKMGGDHPFTWCQQYDGGRSFFTSLGHTKSLYANENFQKLIQGAVVWVSGDDEGVSSKETVVAGNKQHETQKSVPKQDKMDQKADHKHGDHKHGNHKKDGKKHKQDPPQIVPQDSVPIQNGLVLDLNADKGVELQNKAGSTKVEAWRNQVADSPASLFVKRDEGRKVPGSGMPKLKHNVKQIAGHSTLVFDRQELVNMHEDAFDELLTGKGYTWFSVMSVHKQKRGKRDVNSFFGNLRNGPNYEGFWGNLMDDNRVWMGSRNGIKVGEGKPNLWDEVQNPQVVSPEPLEIDRYYLVMGRMGAGKGVVDLDLYVNSTLPVDSKKVPVNPLANSSRMAVGQERDAINHPGAESFSGELSRLLIFDRPLSDKELQTMATHLIETYALHCDHDANGDDANQPVTAAKIIGHWPLDDHTNDVSGQSHNGTVGGQELNYVPGKFGQAAEFRGATTVNCGNVPLGTDGRLTVAIWVKPNRIEQAFAGFVQKQNTDYSERSFWMGQHPKDGYSSWAFFSPTTAQGRPLLSSKPVLVNGQWTHIAITHDGTYQKVYVNGKLDNTSVKWGFGIVDGGDNLRFGRVENTKGGWYSGLMDDIWMFNGALTADEIEELFDGAKTKPAAAEPMP